MEIGAGNKSSFNLVYGLNPWTFNKGKENECKVRHWVVMPEYRWWTCMRFNGHFFGIHALGGEFNASNVDLPIPGAFFCGDNIAREVRDSRYQSWFAGGGVTYGYQWSLSPHWNIEAEIGVGYAHLWYDRYACGECGGKIRSGESNYAGVTKLGVSILYIF